MKKIIIAILLVACIVIGVTACKKDNEPEETEATTTEATTAITTTAEILTEREPRGMAIGEVAEASTPEARFASNPALVLCENTPDTSPTVVPYLSNGSAGTIILVQGIGEDGGYYISEGAPVARLLASRGYDVFICKYRLGGYIDDIVADIGRAVKYVRYHSEAFGLGEQKVSVMGFGAGAWLAYVEDCDGVDDDSSDEIAAILGKPDALIMVNPDVSPDKGIFAGFAPVNDPAKSDKIAVFYESDMPDTAKILNFVFSLKSEKAISTVEVHSINNTTDYKAGGDRTANYESLYELLDNFIKII